MAKPDKGQGPGRNHDARIERDRGRGLKEDVQSANVVSRRFGDEKPDLVRDFVNSSVKIVCCHDRYRENILSMSV